jgi:multicomponent Na+:H+ antiporter subunit E
MKKILIGSFLFIIWLFLTWPFNPLALQDLFVGLVVVVLTVMFIAPKNGDTAKILEYKRYYWLAVYVPVLAYYMIKANFDVLYRVIHPEMPINPGIVTVKTKLRTPIARAMLCNSITLTPGTLTVDIIGEDIFVHWINITQSTPDEITWKIAGRFERLLTRIFE